MLLEEFDYTLPAHQIAQHPADQRTHSKLLTLQRNSENIQHSYFYNLVDYLVPGDCLILNNSRVMPARLHGHKDTGGKVEILIERILDNQRVIALVGASKPVRINSVLTLAGQVAKVISVDEGMYQLEFANLDNVLNFITEQGIMPLPPYIERKPTADDDERYQTVYSEIIGSVAAPTAGLHFDNDLLAVIHAKGVQVAYLTLHVGAGTFQPIRDSNINNHKMHPEHFEISEETCNKIYKAKAAGCRAIAVGTTSLRCLEHASKNGKLEAMQGDTDLFITPGFKFNTVDALITNFHLPKTSLLMLISAFAGKDNVKQAYQAAIENEYRFYSYGDAMFVY